jgi:hypothetical protein
MTPSEVAELGQRIREHLASPEFEARIAPFRTPVTEASMRFMLD